MSGLQARVNCTSRATFTIKRRTRRTAGRVRLFISYHASQPLLFTASNSLPCSAEQQSVHSVTLPMLEQANVHSTFPIPSSSKGPCPSPVTIIRRLCTRGPFVRVRTAPRRSPYVGDPQTLAPSCAERTWSDPGLILSVSHY